MNIGNDPYVLAAKVIAAEHRIRDWDGSSVVDVDIAIVAQPSKSTETFYRWDGDVPNFGEHKTGRILFNIIAMDKTWAAYDGRPTLLKLK